MKFKAYTKRRGFTLVEVLIVVAIILTLGSLVVFGVGKARVAAQKAESINDIKGLSSRTLMDAGDNNGSFSESKTHFGNLPFWISFEWRDKHDVSRDIAYSSANKCWTKEGKDVCQNNRDLWKYNGEETSSLFSYACLIDNLIWTEGGSFVPPEEWERIKDDIYNEDEDDYRWTPARMSQDVAYPILWIDLAMVWNSKKQGNFMKKDGDPEGVHIGYLDGHVEWVRKVKPRFSRPNLTLYW